jgi:hypothetical protein
MWKSNMKMNNEENRWMELVQDRVQWRLWYHARVLDHTVLLSDCKLDCLKVRGNIIIFLNKFYIREG